MTTRMPKTAFLAQLQQMMRVAHLSQRFEMSPAAVVARTSGISRRDFLRAGSALGAGIAALNIARVTRLYAQGEPPRIAIVGGGLAGMTCAYYLMQAGITPAVYEARDRVGGRTYSGRGVISPNLVTELGGEFINSDHEDMLALVTALELDLLDRFVPSQLALEKEAVTFGGRSYTNADLVALYTPYAARIAADVATIDVDDAVFATYDAMSIADYLADVGIDGLLYDFFDSAFTTENGLEIAEQNALNFLYLAPALDADGSFDTVAPSDEQYKVIGGNQQICERIAALLGENLRLDTVLQAVSADNKGVSLETLCESARCGIQTREYDYVVLAIPLSVLRNIPVSGITAEQKTAVDSLGYGTNGKLIVGMQERVWQSQGYSGYVYTDEQFLSGWDSSELQDTPDASYTFFNGGVEGVDFAEGTPESVAQTYLAGLEKIFPGVLASYTGVVLRQAWATDAYALGSYSCPLPEQYDFYEALNAVEGRILLAGEHTSANYFGYMNGAAESGRLAYERLMEIIQKTVNG